jgi:hypothetical protein
VSLGWEEAYHGADPAEVFAVVEGLGFGGEAGDVPFYHRNH